MAGAAPIAPIEVDDSAPPVSQAAEEKEVEKQAALEEEKEREKDVAAFIDEVEGLDSDDDQLQRVYDESKMLAEIDKSKKIKNDAELEQVLAASQKSCRVRRRPPSSPRDPRAAHSWDTRTRAPSTASRKSTGTIVSKKSQPEETPERQRGRRRTRDAHCWSPKGTTFVGGRQSSQLLSPSPSPSPPATQPSPSESPLDARRRRARPPWQRRGKSARALAICSSDSEHAQPRGRPHRRGSPTAVGTTGGAHRRGPHASDRHAAPEDNPSPFDTPEKHDMVKSVKGAHAECAKTVQASSVPNQ